MFLFVFLTGLLSIPVLWIKNEHIINPLYFQLMSVFLIGFFIMSVFYLVANFSKKESLVAFAKLFPMFLSVSMALSFHNSIAVLEGLFGFKSDFIRTPKFNITQIKDSFKENIYVKRNLSKAFYIELFFELLFPIRIGDGILLP